MIRRSLESIQGTRIVVAHRISTVIGADRIRVFEDGRLVEEGKYDELMTKDGFFAELVRRQTV
jgi:ABC-type multidrug transport system fused ATPase/permease subunit